LTIRIELTPTLDHCIETTARQEFARNAAAYMQSGERDVSLEERIELLRMFLESADFRYLRRRSEPHLAKGRTVRFILSMQDGKANHTMKVDR
jgi:hypothetical protein